MDTDKIEVSPFAVSLQIEKVGIQLIDFHLNATEGSVEVTRYTKNDRFVDAQTVNIPPEIYAKWGTDDSIIVDYALQQLKMSRLQPPAPKKRADGVDAKPHTAQKR